MYKIDVYEWVKMNLYKS